MVHNAWMGVKICFANEIDQLCRVFHADTRQVLRIAFEENERGRLMTLSHMMPVPPYSVACLPKDAAVLGGIVAEHAPKWMQSEGICHALRTSNERFVEALVEEWLTRGRDSGRPLGIVGTSFRPDFNEMRFSLALPFIRRAQSEGLTVLGYDPAFEGLGQEEYLLACRGDKELEGLYDRVLSAGDGVEPGRGAPHAPPAVRSRASTVRGSPTPTWISTRTSRADGYPRGTGHSVACLAHRAIGREGCERPHPVGKGP